MKLTLSFITILLLAPLAMLRSADAPQARMDERHRAFFKDYCVECHNEKKQKGKLRLDDVSFALDSVESADRWQKILNQINSGEMPPDDAKQPERWAKTDFLEALSRTLVAARKSLGDVRGQITMRRLNRREYKNTIRDLLGVDIRVNELSADGGAGTFDTVGSSLFMSSDQVEQYLALGRQALDEHFARFVAPAPSAPRVMHVEAEEKNAKIAKSLAARTDARQRYEKWTAAVDAAAQRTENADVAAAIRAEKKNDATHFYSQWQRIKGAPSPKDFGFVDEVNADQMGRRDWEHYVRHHRAYVEHPATKTGAFLTIEDVEVNPYHAFRISGDWPAGDYMVRVCIAATSDTPASRHFVEFGSQHDTGVRAVISSHQITGTMEKPQVLEIPLKFSPANGRGFFFQEKGSYESENAARQIFEEVKKRNGIGPEFALWLDWIEVAGKDSAPKGPIVKQATIAKTTHIEPESRRAEVERGHLRYKFLNEQYVKWRVAGGDEAKLKDFGFTDKSHAEFSKYVWEQNNRWFQQYLDWPLSKTGLYLDNTVQETCEYAIDMPADLASGDYVMRVKIGRVPDMPAERAFLTFVEASPIDKDDRTFLANKQITATLDKPEVVELPFKIRPGGPRKFVLMEKRPLKKEGISLPGRTRLITDAKQRDPVLWIDWIEYEGPLQKRDEQGAVEPVLFANTTGASEHDHARTVIEKFAVRAFRDKTPDAAYLDKLAALFDTRRKAGDAFDVAIREPLSVVLASPGFLYLQESGAGADADKETGGQGDKEKASAAKTNISSSPHLLVPLSGPELASRLSYFLWSAPPDEPLLALARSGDLTKPDVLAREVDRLIASPKADAFVSGFLHQWLDMERLDFFQFDTKQFRDFDESAKAAARREVYETFAHLMRGNGSLSRLLKSDEIFVNGLLATYYGIEGVTGDEFQRVKLPADSPRGGLLGMAAILAMGSNGERTSPVERGAWILRKLLHDPPPPAPKNVPQLSRLENKILTARERIIAHQEEPQCAQCHRKIDPIGFGLENFNATGKWRTEETYEKRGVGKKTWQIYPSGAFHNGPAFKDYFELRDLIAAQPERFARGFTEHLIEYALGRPFGFVDEPLADEIVKRAKVKDFTIREFIVALASSKEFFTK